MIHCKKHIIAIGFCMLPLTGWSEAPVVDDSDNFAIMDGQQVAAARSKYEDPSQNAYYSTNEDGPPLVRDEGSSDLDNPMRDNAKLINKILALEKEIQELRGQLEVQAHDLKLLQQQQTAFYNAKVPPAKSTMDVAKPAPVKARATPVINTKSSTVIVPEATSAHGNPADEQISYLAAYELVSGKNTDKGIMAMQTFIQKYPKSNYAANAHYWLGELHLVKKEYAQSINQFNLVLNQFPGSTKSAASLLKIAYAYEANGNKAEAIKKLQQVVVNYPGSATAALADSKLKSIKAL